MSPELITAGKYIGSVSAALYGIWATLTDFHEVRNDEKRLTKTGRYAILLLVASSSLNIFFDGQKEKQQDISNKAEADQRSALIEAQRKTNALAVIQLDEASKTARQLIVTQAAVRSTSEAVGTASRDTLSTLDVAKRLNDPLGTPIFYVHMAVKSSTATQGFAERYVREQSDSGFFMKGDPVYPDINTPGERTLSILASVEGFEMQFESVGAGKPRTHLVYSSTCAPRNDQQEGRSWEWDGVRVLHRLR